MGIKDAEIEQQVRRWFVMSVLTGRYSASPESQFDLDIRNVHAQGIETYSKAVIASTLSDAFWDFGLPQSLEVSAAYSPYYRAFTAAQVKLGDRGFLSRDISIRELVEVKSDVHHIFPKEFLKSNGLSRWEYNQVANFAITQSEINIAIGRKEPKVYFGDVMTQSNGGEKKYGNITDLEELKENLTMNCIPEGFGEMGINEYGDFLALRRKLMASRMRLYFESL